MEHATDRGSRETCETIVHEKLDFRKFHEKLKLVDVLAIKFHEISSLARISFPAAPRPGWGPGPPRRRNEIHSNDFLFSVIQRRYAMHARVTLNAFVRTASLQPTHGLFYFRFSFVLVVCLRIG